MKTLIFICLIAFTHSFTTEEILQKFDGNTNFGLEIELYDGSLIKNSCFFTAKTIPNKAYQHRKENIFIPREDITCAIKKELIKKIIISSSYAGKLLLLKNSDLINSDLIKEKNSYKIYNSKIFGKIKVKNRNLNNKAPITSTTNNKEIVRIGKRIYIPSNIKNIQGLADFKIIESLDLSNSKVVDISSLKGMQNLRELNLSNSKVVDISSLKGMPKLQYLYLSNSKVVDISSLKGMPNLKNLDISNSKVVDISALKGMPNLKWLNLSNSKAVDIRALKGMPNLKWLNLSNSQVVDIRALKEMPKLEEVNLSNSQVVDISALKGMSNLRDLNLSNTKINNFNVLQDLPSLASLDISNNKVFGCKVLSKLKRLSQLNIINTKLVNFEKFSSSLKKLSLNQGNIDLTKIISQLDFIHFDFKNKNHLAQVMKSKIEGISFESFKGDFSFVKDLHSCIELNFNNTNFADLTLLKKQVNTLRALHIENCPIKDFSFLKKINYLDVYLNVKNDKLQELIKQYPYIFFWNLAY